MFTYNREGYQPPIGITELNKDNLSSFGSDSTWEQRTEIQRKSRDFHPRESLIGRVAVTGHDFLANILQEQALAEPEGILSNRVTLMNALLDHNDQTGPHHPLFSGRGGNEPLRGMPINIPDDGTLWGTSPELFNATIGSTMNNPFHYLNTRLRSYDAARNNGEPLVPAIAVFDRDKLREAKGNNVDKTSWKVKRGSPLGAVASMYYFDPHHFTMDRR